MRKYRRLDIAIAVLVVAGLSACTGSAGASPAPPASVAAPAAATTAAPPSATAAAEAQPTAASPTPDATPDPVAVTTDLEYESADPRVHPQALDVYAPTTAGPHPVVVMFHGGPGVINKDWTGLWASLAAAEGFVVFAPTWGVNTAAGRELTQSEQLESSYRQAACAVAFARAHAAEYGGDPSRIILFGHSAGANAAARIAFNDVVPTEGCPAGDATGPIAAIITYEGDWLFDEPMWDGVVRDEPELLEAGLPWTGLSAHPELPVVMLVSEGSGGLVDVPAGNPPVESWATARDPIALREQFLTAGADGERIDIAQSQAILHAALEAQGNPVSLTEVPGADHMTIGMRGRPALFAALQEALGR